MFARHLILAVALCLTIGSFATAQTPVSDGWIRSVVRKLGSSSFVNRDKASKDLQAAGPGTLEPLRRIGKTGDAEVDRRIGEMIRDFEGQIWMKQVLAPKEVNLQIKDVSVRDAITGV